VPSTTRRVIAFRTGVFFTSVAGSICCEKGPREHASFPIARNSEQRLDLAREHLEAFDNRPKTDRLACCFAVTRFLKNVNGRRVDPTRPPKCRARDRTACIRRRRRSVPAVSTGVAGLSWGQVRASAPVITEQLSVPSPWTTLTKYERPFGLLPDRRHHLSSDIGACGPLFRT
jgi:hypothetical protein